MGTQQLGQGTGRQTNPLGIQPIELAQPELRTAIAFQQWIGDVSVRLNDGRAIIVKVPDHTPAGCDLIMTPVGAQAFRLPCRTFHETYRWIREEWCRLTLRRAERLSEIPARTPHNGGPHGSPSRWCWRRLISLYEGLRPWRWIDLEGYFGGPFMAQVKIVKEVA